jgi:hypothetical protein
MTLREWRAYVLENKERWRRSVLAEYPEQHSEKHWDLTLRDLFVKSWRSRFGSQSKPYTRKQGLFV